MMPPLLHSWLIGLALLLLLCILMLAGRGGDAAILAALASLRSPALDIFWRSITHLGSLWILLPACTLLWALPATRAGGLLALASLIGASLLCNVLKLLVDRPRPSGAILDTLPMGASFPSAHAAQAFAVALALCWHSRHHAAAPWLLASLLACALLVGLSRLYLQVHYPSDVLAGMLLALLWSAGLIHWMEK